MTTAWRVSGRCATILQLPFPSSTPPPPPLVTSPPFPSIHLFSTSFFLIHDFTERVLHWIQYNPTTIRHSTPHCYLSIPLSSTFSLLHASIIRILQYIQRSPSTILLSSVYCYLSTFPLPSISPPLLSPPSCSHYENPSLHTKQSPYYPQFLSSFFLLHLSSTTLSLHRNYTIKLTHHFHYLHTYPTYIQYSR